DALEQVNPHISDQFQEAIYFPELSNIRNPRVLQSLIRYLKQHPNVEFFEHTPVKKLIQQGDVIQALQTEDGRKHTADHFVITSGAWSHY
ncbi:FAD-dependent oxidoreductase, partial [Acinetobacter baumannii]